MDRADLLIKNISVYNSVFRKFYLADVYVKGKKIYYVDVKQEGLIEYDQIIDGTGKYMAPGLVDVHMHIESSMMTPLSMAGRLAQCGVTTIVSEPHEMANVNGTQGILDMMKAGENAPIDIFYGIPSCVPATDPSLETTGGIMRMEDMKQLLDNPNVACIGEIMNYRQIIRENDLEISKLLDYLHEEYPRYVIEGHCPALVDLDLAKFIYLGIDSDHTEHNVEELKQRFFHGMYVEIQEKMMRQEILDFIMENNLYGHFGFVTDDVMADTLMDHGHLDCIVRKAIAMGMSPEQAIYHATYTNAVRMKLTDRTMIAPGKLADFLILDDLNHFHIEATYKNGTCIYDASSPSGNEEKNAHAFPDCYRHSVKLDPIDPKILTLHAPDANCSKVTVEVMCVCDGSTKTVRKEASLPVVNGEIQWENSGLLLAVVIERYGKSGAHPSIGYGFVTGDLLKRGAAATTFAHDHHNLLAAGSTKEDLLLAINTVIEMQGGMAVTDQGKVMATLLLNIGGILSDASAKEIGEGLKKVRNQMIEQGYHHYNPIMSFCTLSLLASPALKISDKGIVDVSKAKVTPLIKSFQ